MVEKLMSKFYWVFGIVMMAGFLHTMSVSNSGSNWATYHISGFDSPTTDVRVFPQIKKVVAFYPRKDYSTNTILLARMIKERFSSSNYDQDLLIAQCINKDTKGLAWPTPLAVASIIEIESQYNQSAVSNCGAKGLMQISPLWQNQIPSSAYTSIEGNIRYGVKILNTYYSRYDGNKMAAILSYNSGDHAYNKGKAWPTYWWRYKSAKTAFDILYQQTV